MSVLPDKRCRGEGLLSPVFYAQQAAAEGVQLVAGFCSASHLSRGLQLDGRAARSTRNDPSINNGSEAQ